MNGFYILNSLIYSLIGGVIGYRYCAMTLDIDSMKRRLNEIEDSSHPVQVEVDPLVGNPPPEPDSWWRLHRPTTVQLVGIVVVFMAVASAAASYASSREVRAVNACLNTYVEDTNAALRARDDVAVKYRMGLSGYIDASDKLWMGFLANAPQPGQQATPAQRAASIAVLDVFRDSSRTTLAALDLVGQAKLEFPLPDANCASPKMPRQ